MLYTVVVMSLFNPSYIYIYIYIYALIFLVDVYLTNTTSTNLVFLISNNHRHSLKGIRVTLRAIYSHEGKLVQYLNIEASLAISYGDPEVHCSSF